MMINDLRFEMRMKIEIVFVILLGCIIAGCTGEEEDVFNGAEWIQDLRPLPGADSLFYLENPAPLFRKEFTTDRQVKSAKLYITAAGYYKFSLNGNGSEKNILSPAWTDYNRRIYYSVYDISHKLTEGENCLGVALGNGFYNPLPLRMWGHLNLREKLSVGKPCFKARLIIEYENGRKQIHTRFGLFQFIENGWLD